MSAPIVSIRVSTTRSDWPAAIVPPLHGNTTSATRTPSRGCHETASRPRRLGRAKHPDRRRRRLAVERAVRCEEHPLPVVDRHERRQAGVDRDLSRADDRRRIGARVERPCAVLGELLRDVVGPDPQVLLDREVREADGEGQGRGGGQEERDSSAECQGAHGTFDGGRSEGVTVTIRGGVDVERLEVRDPQVLDQVLGARAAGAGAR